MARSQKNYEQTQLTPLISITFIFSNEPDSSRCPGCPQVSNARRRSGESGAVIRAGADRAWRLVGFIRFQGTMRLSGVRAQGAGDWAASACVDWACCRRKFCAGRVNELDGQRFDGEPLAQRRPRVRIGSARAGSASYDELRTPMRLRTPGGYWNTILPVWVRPSETQPGIDGHPAGNMLRCPLSPISAAPSSGCAPAPADPFAAW